MGMRLDLMTSVVIAHFPDHWPAEGPVQMLLGLAPEQKQKYFHRL